MGADMMMVMMMVVVVMMVYVWCSVMSFVSNRSRKVLSAQSHRHPSTY